MLEVIFDGKAFYPEKPIDFIKPNTHYTIIIEQKEKDVPNQTFIKILERASDLGITDLAKQHDHYLYGTDKV